jgi:O-antigen ligase
MNAVILTQSRGGFLALGAAGLGAWFFSPKRYRPFISVAMVLGGCMFLLLANEQFWERVSTIDEASGGEQSDTRLQIIGPQFEMFKDHPWGAGYRGNAILSPKYMPPELMSNAGIRSAHNTFMAALVDQGIPGALLLLSFYGWGFVTLVRLKRLDKQGLDPRFGVYRAALGASLGTCAVAGLFLNLMTFEVQIWLATLLASLSNLAHRSLKKLPAGVEGEPQQSPLAARAST